MTNFKKWIKILVIDFTIYTLTLCGFVFDVGNPYTGNIAIFLLWFTIALATILIPTLHYIVKQNEVKKALPKWTSYTYKGKVYSLVTSIFEVALLAAVGYFFTAFCIAVVQIFWHGAKVKVDEHLENGGS